MKRQELIELFDRYLRRLPTKRDIISHGRKNYKDFEFEISRCTEYLELQKKPKAAKKGKIAVLISGHIRHNNINRSFHRLDDYDYDVFIHTWDNLGFKGSETNLNDRVDVDKIKTEISKIPNVKSFEIDNNKNFINSLPPVDFTYFNFSSPEVFIKSQLYSVKKSYDIFEEYQLSNNITYDLVIRTRFENEFSGFLVDDALLDDITNDIIFAPNKGCGHEHPDSNSTTCSACEKMYTEHKLRKVHTFDHTHIICDVFAYGNQRSMKHYCSLYDSYDNLNRSFEKQNREVLKSTKIIHEIKNNVCHLEMTPEGHIDSLYYINCSYPERLLQFHLKKFLIPESEKIKIKFVR
jgi:hypothetical protein